jgi:type IV secretory pathway VirB4 component
LPKNTHTYFKDCRLDEGTSTKIFLPNPSARAEGAAALYRRFGLNDREVDILASAIPKREYYMVSERGRRLIDLSLSPFALAFVGVSDKDAIAEVKRCEAVYGEGWVNEWLARKGVATNKKNQTERLVLA